MVWVLSPTRIGILKVHRVSQLARHVPRASRRPLVAHSPVGVVQTSRSTGVLAPSDEFTAPLVVERTTSPRRSSRTGSVGHDSSRRGLSFEIPNTSLREVEDMAPSSTSLSSAVSNPLERGPPHQWGASPDIAQGRETNTVSSRFSSPANHCRTENRTISAQFRSLDLEVLAVTHHRHFVRCLIRCIKELVSESKRH